MYNTIIIGAGPAGMAAALYLQRSGIDVLIIDKDAPGGQLLKTDIIENYLGFESISGADLALNMYNQIKKIGVKYVFGNVTNITKDKIFKVSTESNNYECENIIIATGKINNKLNLENEDKIKGISYCAICDGAFYKNKDVAIVGAGNTAYTEALYLSNIVNKVYIINRTDNIKADKILQNRVKSKENIIYISGAKVTKLNDNNNILSSIILNDERILEIDGLFLAIGGKPNINFIEGLSTKNGYLIVDNKMKTNIKNIYGIGDAIEKDHYQIATAVNDGVIAALSIQEGETK